MAISGERSSQALPTPVVRLVAPGPSVAMQSPGLPVMRPVTSAAKPAEPSCAVSTKSTPPLRIASISGSTLPLGMPKPRSMPAAFSVATMRSALFMGQNAPFGLCQPMYHTAVPKCSRAALVCAALDSCIAVTRGSGENVGDDAGIPAHVFLPGSACAARRFRRSWRRTSRSPRSCRPSPRSCRRPSPCRRSRSGSSRCWCSAPGRCGRWPARRGSSSPRPWPGCWPRSPTSACRRGCRRRRRCRRWRRSPSACSPD